MNKNMAHYMESGVVLYGIIRVDINILHAPKYHIPWEFYYSSIAHTDEQ